MQRLTVCVASLCLPMLLYRLNATTSLVSRMDWMLEGNWKLPGYETLRSVCQLHTNNDKLKTKSDRQSNARGATSEDKTGQTGSQHPSIKSSDLCLCQNTLCPVRPDRPGTDSVITHMLPKEAVSSVCFSQTNITLSHGFPFALGDDM